MAFDRHSLLGAGLVAVIAAACLAGIIVAGGPGQARREKEDEARLQAMSQTALALACYKQAFGDIPEDMSRIEAELSRVTSPARARPACASASLRKDPVSNEYFRLIREDGAVTGMCADFAATSPGTPDGRYAYLSSGLVIPDLSKARERPGEHCFDLNLNADLDR